MVLPEEAEPPDEQAASDRADATKTVTSRSALVLMAQCYEGLASSTTTERRRRGLALAAHHTLIGGRRMLRDSNAGRALGDNAGRVRRWRFTAGMGAVVVALATLAVGAGPAVAAGRLAHKAAVPGSLNAVACTSSTSCIAVGSYGSSGATLTLAEAWNGTAWTVQPTPNPSGGSNSTLAGLSCGAAGSCVAVGGYYNGHGDALLAETWDGTSWTIQTVPLPAGGLGGSLVGVSCSSASSCIAVGSYADSSNTNQPLAEAWNGSNFTPQTVPLPAMATTSTFDAVSCSPSPSVDCEAVGWNFLSGYGEIAMTLAEGWDGTSWTVQNTPIPNNASGGSYPMGISCGSPDACTSVGEADNGSGELSDGWAQVWNGTSWSNQTTANPTGSIDSILSAVSCSASPSTDCTAVGYYSNGSTFASFAEAWKGTKVKVQKTPEPKGSTSGGLDGVSCSSPPGTCTAVGSVSNSSGVGVTLAEGFNGRKWMVQKTPKP